MGGSIWAICSNVVTFRSGRRTAYDKRLPVQMALMKNAPINRIPKNHLPNFDCIRRFPPAMKPIIVSINDENNPSRGCFQILRAAQRIIATKLQMIKIEIVTARNDAEADGIWWR